MLEESRRSGCLREALGVHCMDSGQESGRCRGFRRLDPVFRPPGNPGESRTLPGGHMGNPARADGRRSRRNLDSMPRPWARLCRSSYPRFVQISRTNPMVGAVLQSRDKVYDAPQQVEPCKDKNMEFGARVVPCPATVRSHDRRGRRKTGHSPLQGGRGAARALKPHRPSQNMTCSRIDRMQLPRRELCRHG